MQLKTINFIFIKINSPIENAPSILNEILSFIDTKYNYSHLINSSIYAGILLLYLGLNNNDEKIDLKDYRNKISNEIFDVYKNAISLIHGEEACTLFTSGSFPFRSNNKILTNFKNIIETLNELDDGKIVNYS